MRSSGRTKIRQVLVGAARYDAITQVALEIRRLCGSDHETEVFSWFAPDSSVAESISHISACGDGDPDDVLVYHLSYGIPELTQWLLCRPERLIIWFHNVTPAHFYETIDSQFASGLAHGRQEIETLRERCDLAVTVSDFNASELRDAGYLNVRVARPSSTATRLRHVGASSRMIHELQQRFPSGFVLAVSQVLPHKRADFAVEVSHLLRDYHGLDVGLVWAGPIRLPRYKSALDDLVIRLNSTSIWFTDAVGEAELAALYRACTCFISVSEHEGLSIPPLEAMECGAPVVVRGAAAIPETVGDGAIVVPPEWGVIGFAEVVAEVCRKPDLRRDLRVAGRHWLETGRSDNSLTSVMEIIVELVR